MPKNEGIPNSGSPARREGYGEKYRPNNRIAEVTRDGSEAQERARYEEQLRRSGKVGGSVGGKDGRK